MEIVEKRPRHMTEGSQDLIFKHQCEEFFGLQKQLFALLPKQSIYINEPVPAEMWIALHNKKVSDLMKMASESDGGVIDISDIIGWLCAYLQLLQESMAETDLAKACSLLRKIEEMAHQDMG